MKLASYNIHYAIGKDNNYDLQRVIESVRGADIIALQEVERNYGPPHQPSQPEEIAQLLPDYYWVYDAAFDFDGSEILADGKILNRRRQHGQMLLSRWPVLSKRYFPFPRMDTGDVFNMQMGVLEGVIQTPVAAIRVYVVHFGAVSSEERQRQAVFLLDLIRNAPAEGGPWTGQADDHPDRDWTAGSTRPPMPESALIIGDFNCETNSPEYALLKDAKTSTGDALLTDTWAQFNTDKSVVSWHPNPGREGDEKSALLDYCFVTGDLLSRIPSCWIDELADGSDHQPIWVEID